MPQATNRLDQIRARLAAAPPGPWRWNRSHEITVREDALVIELRGDPGHVECAQLIAHAPEDLRLLLAVADAAGALFAGEEDAESYQPPSLWGRLGLALAALSEEKEPDHG